MGAGGTTGCRLSRRVGIGLAAAVLAFVGACGSDTASAPSAPTPTAATGSASSAEVTAPPLTSASSTAVEPTSESASVPEMTTSVDAVPSAPATTEDAAPEVAPPAPTTTTPSTSAAPSTSATPSTTATPTSTSVRGDGSGRVVVIDPGHNGANGENPSIVNAQVDAGFGDTKPCNTTGTSTNAGYPEHAFTWAVAGRVRDLLSASGVTVVMTRDSDDGVGPCVNERAAIGNEAGADAVVSLHGDGSAAGDRGFYAMTSERLPNGETVGTESVELATAVRDGLIAAGASPSNYVGTDGLWKRDDLAGLNLSQVPTTMVELGNMRDADDAAFMKSDAGQDALAAGIAQGILDWLAVH